MSQFTPITQDQVDKREVKIGPQIIPGTEKRKALTLKDKLKTLVLLTVWSKHYEE